MKQYAEDGSTGVAPRERKRKLGAMELRSFAEYKQRALQCLDRCL